MKEKQNTNQRNPIDLKVIKKNGIMLIFYTNLVRLQDVLG